MSSYPQYSYRDVARKLRLAGFILKRQAKGSHEIWVQPESGRMISVPHHSGLDIPVGTLRAIIKATGLTLDEFNNL